MEPLLGSDADRKRAPIVVWSNDSPVPNPSSPSSDIFKTANTSPTPGDLVSADHSNCSSGIGSTSDCTTYSPALSNADHAEEESTQPNTPVKDPMDLVLPSNHNNNNNLMPNNIVKNGDINRDAQIASEGVKFIDSDGQIISIDRDDSICSSGSDDEEDDKKPKVPDGGWGWMVVFSSLVISMVADGISFSFGLLYIEFLQHFGESKAKTAWIGSLFMAVPLLTGPIMSALVDRFGCKWMTMLGGLVSGFGFVLAMFGNSVEWELVTFGVIAGLGLGLCYVTAVVSVCFWFEKKRTLATGLGASGTGLGTFVYAPMTQFFIEEYGWRGTVLMLAGTFFNMCVCGALMRDPEWILEQKEQASLAGTKSIRNASSCGSISGADRESQFPGPEEIRNMMKSGQSPEYILTTLATTLADNSNDEVKEEVMTPPTFHSVVNLPTFIKESEKVPLEVIQQMSSNTKLFKVILENYPSLLYCRSMSDKGKLNEILEDPMSNCKRVPVTMSMRLKPTKKPAAIGPPIQECHSLEAIDPSSVPLLPDTTIIPMPTIVPARQNHSPEKASQAVPYMRRQFSIKEPGQHYLKHIRIHRNSVMYRGAVLNTPKYHLRASSCPNIYRNSMTTIAKESEEKWYSDALEMCKGMVDFSMFLELHFLLMSLATILLFTFFIVPLFYLAEHMTRYGYNESDGSHMLSVIGICNCLGMVGLGWCGDQPWMNVMKTYSVCLVFCGASCIMMPLVTTNFYALILSCCLFGLFFASNYSFTPVIVVELIPLERFTTAYGLILLCQGIGNLLGPPLAGYIFDMTGAWDIAFYMAGLFIAIAGVLVAFIPLTKNRRIWGEGLLENDRVSNA